jgi:hypothetical protein
MVARMRCGSVRACSRSCRACGARPRSSLELMTVRGEPLDAMLRDYAELAASGEGGVYVALKVGGIAAAEDATSTIRLESRGSSSGPWRFLSFPPTSPAAAVFFSAGSAVHRIRTPFCYTSRMSLASPKPGSRAAANLVICWSNSEQNAAARLARQTAAPVNASRWGGEALLSFRRCRRRARVFWVWCCGLKARAEARCGLIRRSGCSTGLKVPDPLSDEVRSGTRHGSHGRLQTGRVNLRTGGSAHSCHLQVKGRS